MDKCGQILEKYGNLPNFLGVDLKDCNTQGNFGDFPIHVAVVQGILEDVRSLLSCGADIEAKGEHGYTPLHEAVEQENIEVIKLLLDAGASLGAETDEGVSVIELAKDIGSKEIIGTLTEYESE